MRILVNNKIKRLFSCVLIFFILFTAVSVICVSLRVHYAVYCVLLSSLAMGIAVFASIYLYFRDQNKIMEDAVSQIKDYISGDRNARIECDDEGELYRLFHEVNSLVSILNAQAENEGRSKKFMKDTISNISHQLKTPLAALNIYNVSCRKRRRIHRQSMSLLNFRNRNLTGLKPLYRTCLKLQNWMQEQS